MHWESLEDMGNVNHLHHDQLHTTECEWQTEWQTRKVSRKNAGWKIMHYRVITFIILTGILKLPYPGSSVNSLIISIWFFWYLWLEWISYHWLLCPLVCPLGILFGILLSTTKSKVEQVWKCGVHLKDQNHILWRWDLYELPHTPCYRESAIDSEVLKLELESLLPQIRVIKTSLVSQHWFP